MKRAAAYIRVSTDEQLEYSPESQRKKIVEYAIKNKIELPEIFIFTDEGISGRSASKRPGFQKMISIAKQKPKPFDMILVYSLSRFARSREDSVVYKKMLRNDLDIDIISISQEFGNDKTSILIEALLEAMDEYYSIDLAENVKRGMEERVHRGEIITCPPLGYRIDNGKYVIDDEKKYIVELIFKMYTEGSTFFEIASYLNDNHIMTNRNKKFQSRTVKYILKNPVYIGKLKWYDDYINGVHEPVINTQIWECTQKLLSMQ